MVSSLLVASKSLRFLIVINVREETTRTEIHEETIYTQTTLIRNDFHYTVKGIFHQINAVYFHRIFSLLKI